MTETIGPMEGTTVEGMHGSKIDSNAYGIHIYMVICLSGLLDMFGHMADTSWTHSKSN